MVVMKSGAVIITQAAAGEVLLAVVEQSNEEHQVLRKKAAVKADLPVVVLELLGSFYDMPGSEPLATVSAKLLQGEPRHMFSGFLLLPDWSTPTLLD